MENIYTDLALEIAEQLQAGANEIDGVELDVEELDDIRVTTVRITNEAGEAAMGKPVGSYITIESPEIKANNITAHEEIIKILTIKLEQLARGIGGTTLVVGLGNRSVTPDALGPKVVSKLLVTRHVLDSLPKELAGGLRPLCALAPGVMGTTGIETAEVVCGLISNVKPDLVIAIDALAARKIDRINQTIQLTDTGISPGAGVGNARKPLNKESLGVPVIAIGVPTVVSAATFVNDTLEILLEKELVQMPQNLCEQERYIAVKGALEPEVGNLFVTPKEIGEVVGWLSSMIANGINLAMHSGVDMEDINRFMY